MGIFCCYFSTSFRSANPNFGLRPKLGVRLVFGLSEKTQRKTNPKSEVAHCGWSPLEHDSYSQQSHDQQVQLIQLTFTPQSLSVHTYIHTYIHTTVHVVYNHTPTFPFTTINKWHYTQIPTFLAGHVTQPLCSVILSQSIYLRTADDREIVTTANCRAVIWRHCVAYLNIVYCQTAAVHNIFTIALCECQ